MRFLKPNAIEAATDAVLARIGPSPLLILFTLVMLLPGFVTLPPMDRDEPRFAQASKQMLETGDFVDIRFG
ncbi:MAG TPA: glycosyl transferase, partial [Beijerinckiaceae bacterium]|nr:glycosyl transferase [Beijerinckiaceae bacterium]